MREIFCIGGVAMYPTALFGLLMIGAAVRYAFKPESRFIPLQVTLAVLTLFSGMFGFVTGLITSFAAMSSVPADANKWIPLVGAAESMYNLALALALVVFASIAASVGAARLAGLLPRYVPAKA